MILEHRMRRFWMISLFTLICALQVQSQEAVPSAISAAYDNTLSALQAAKSSADIGRMVEAMDAPDWIGLGPSGEKMGRSEAEKQLEGLLSIPPGQRPTPLQQVIYVSEHEKQALVVYWVYRKTDQGAVGSLVRDTWIQIASGWRRSLHEKLFPDRLLELPK